MSRYPFTPELLDALPEDLAELFRALELVLLDEICSRLKAADELNEVTVQGIRALRSHGIDLKEIKKAIRETSGISKTKLDKLLDDVVARNQQYYTDMIDLAHITQPETLVDAAEVAAIRTQTLDTFHNLTASMGFLVDAGRTMLPPAKAYQWVLDSAALQVQSGAINYNQAIKTAVKELADSGLKVVDYESGHQDHIDVAVRRSVMTGVSQICAKYTEQSAEYLDTPYFEVSAHVGARDKPGPSPWSSHKDWQGRVYSVRAGDIYPSIYDVCGLGAVDGLEGANCRHRRFPWVEGVSERTYTGEQLKHIDDGHSCTFDGKNYTAYEATQMQRRIERTVRKLKREKAAYKAAGLHEDETAVNIRLRRLNAKYKAFSSEAGLTEQPERMRVYNATPISKSIKSAGNGNSVSPGDPVLVGTVDFSDKTAAMKVLSDAEKELADFDYEVNYSVTKDGKVWRVSGEATTVDLSAIPSTLNGSYSYHNHPREKTHYSFSAEDVAFFMDSKEELSIASDDRFIYIMRRTAKTVEKARDVVYNRFKELERTDVFEMMWKGQINPDVDKYHEVMKILSKELEVDYVRKEKNK
nr:MAG TPA: minor capsid protein [Caudoviricetes sp.]